MKRWLFWLKMDCQLFFGVVFREFEGGIISPFTAWNMSFGNQPKRKGGKR